MVSRSVPVLRCLSRRCAARGADHALVALHPRLAHRDDHCPRRVVTLPGGQAGVAAPVVRAGFSYSGQILSYTKMLGQLQNAGNTTTLAHYLDLLAGAGMLTGLQKYSGAAVRRRSSSPKLQVLNTALMTAGSGLTLAQARADPELWGRLVESAVGAHLANAAAAGTCEVFYWRERNREVDFVVRAAGAVTAIEVKSGRARGTPPGMAAFASAFRPTRLLLVGGDGIAVDEFLSQPVEHWV